LQNCKTRNHGFFGDGILQFPPLAVKLFFFFFFFFFFFSSSSSFVGDQSFWC
jgi:hypothetical protein